MKKLTDKIMDEKGSVIIIALLILALLTVIGISATRNTEIETRIAGNGLLDVASRPCQTHP